MKTKIFFTICLLLLPVFAFAQAPESRNLYPFNFEEMTARSYIVVDKDSGAVLLEKDIQVPWTPASMTKLVTAMVALDVDKYLPGYVTIVKQDEVGGARLATKVGVKYRVGDMFFATLVASANNAANALARGTGLSREEFILRMNQKAKALGATNTVFVEPSGIDPKNMTTAADFAKIAAAAFGYPLIQEAAKMKSYTVYSAGGGRYIHKLQTTNQLVADGGFIINGAKTGYLDESRYNFTAELKDVDGKNIIVVLLGSQSKASQFFETKKLAIWTWVNYRWKPPGGLVAGAISSEVGAPAGLQMPK